MVRLLSVALLLSGSSAFGSYTMIRIAGPPADANPFFAVQGAALNNNGVALVNGTFTTGGNHVQAYLATAIDVASPYATLVPLPGPLCCTIGTALNDAGQATGYGYSGFVTYTAMLGTTATASLVPVGSWNDTYGRAINSSGAIAGYGTLVGFTMPFIGDATGITPLPINAAWTSLAVHALDELGVASGVAFNNSTGAWDLWAANSSGPVSASTLVAPDASWSSLTPQAGNKAGTVAGQGVTSGNWVAWVMTAGGVLAPLPAPGTWSYMSVSDVNENGDVLGSGVRGGQLIYWTYSAAQGFVELGPQFSLPVTNAYAMNDRGDILAMSNGALVLLRQDASASSVPEPSSLSLMALAGLLGLASRGGSGLRKP